MRITEEHYFNNRSLPHDAQIYRKKLTVLYAVPVTKTIFTESVCDQRYADCGQFRLRTVICRIFLIHGRIADIS